MNTPLIAYFSYQGHTRRVAAKIQSVTDGTLFEIKPAEAYSTITIPARRRPRRKPETVINRLWLKTANALQQARLFCSAHPTGSIP